MMPPWQLVLVGCFPAYDYMMYMQNLHESLSFAMKVGNYSRASELSDQILDLVCPTP